MFPMAVKSGYIGCVTPPSFPCSFVFDIAERVFFLHMYIIYVAGLKATNQQQLFTVIISIKDQDYNYLLLLSAIKIKITIIGV